MFVGACGLGVCGCNSYKKHENETKTLNAKTLVNHFQATAVVKDTISDVTQKATLLAPNGQQQATDTGPWAARDEDENEGVQEHGQ